MQVSIDYSLYGESNVLDLACSHFVIQTVGGLDEAHLSLGEAVWLESVSHDLVVVKDKNSNFLAVVAHEDVWGEGEHLFVHTLSLILLHNVQVVKVSLDQTLSEASNDTGLQRIVLSSVGLFVLHLSVASLLECPHERLTVEVTFMDLSHSIHLRVLEVDIGGVQRLELVKIELVSNDIETHLVNTIAKNLDTLAELFIISSHTGCAQSLQ